MRTIKPLMLLSTFIAITAVNHITMMPETSSIDKTAFLKSKSIFNGKKTKKQFDKPGEAAAWMAEALVTPKGFTPAQLNLQYQAEIKAAKANKNNQNLPALAFEELGPGVFGGRIRGFVMHPEREGHLLAGGVSGGVWKSTDDGQSWEAKTDFLENIAIGSMLIDPDNPEKVYLGTGEGFFNFDAARGYGIFVSEDFGETWTRYGFTNRTDFYYVNRMVKIPNSNDFLAATRTGIWKTTDEGRIWNKMMDAQDADFSRGFTDLQIDPSDPNHLLAYHFGDPNLPVINLSVSTPSTVAGEYDVIPASFGPAFPNGGLSGEMLLIQDEGNGQSRDACEPIVNDIDGFIALIERGNCNFTDKIINAQNAGAIGVLVFTDGNPIISMGVGSEGDADGITIPSGMISRALGDRLRTGVPPVNMTISNTDEIQFNRFIARSTNGGDFWAKLDNHGLPDLDVLRMEIGFGSDGKAYIAASKDAVELEDGGTNGTIGLYRSIGSDNQNFEKTASNTNFVERQGWYDMAIAVNPSDSDHVIMGAIDLYSSTNGGDFIDRNTFWFAPEGFTDRYIHADHHGYFFSPFNSEHIYVVSDGGVAKSEDGGDSWLALNNGLNISQSYGIDVSPDGSQVISGTQDNGAKLYFGDEQNWLPWAPGDGGYSAWDQQQPEYIYGSLPRGKVYGSNNGGLNIELLNVPESDNTLFIQPFVLDETDGNRMLVGTDKVYFSNNVRSLGSSNWIDTTGELIPNNGNPIGVSAVAFDPHNSSVAYAGMTTSDVFGTNQIVKISSLGSTNTVTDIAPPNSFGVDGFRVTDIKVDTIDTSGNTVYATFGGYFSNRILKTTDGGNSWTSISNNLPNMPLWQVINDPSDPNVLYVGSELGLWVGTQSGNTYNWEQFDYGSAFTRVIDLVWRNDVLYIGTHGRGTFKATKAAIEVELVKFIADNSSCDTDNFLDRGEAGELIISLTNQSARNFDSVNVSFDLPGVISFTNANQTIDLDGFAAEQISIPVELDAGAACLADLNVPVSVDTGDLSYETSISLTTAANQAFTTSTTFSDDAENSDSQLKSALAFGNDGWIRVSDNVNSGDSSWFTTNENTPSDKSLVTPWLTFDAGGNVIRFAMSYDTEGDASQYWDGLVLEMRLKGSDLWFDIGHLSSVPYDGQLNIDNTAQGRFAWSGTQLEWRDASINLGSEYAGKTAQIRWRMVSDFFTAQEGFWLDDITISRVIAPAPLTCDACISDTNSLVPNKGLWYDPARDGHGFIIEAFGRDMLFYTMFYTFDDQGNPEWFNSLTTLENGVLNPEFVSGSINGFTYNTAVDPAEVDPLILDTQLDGRLTINFNNAEIRNDPACQDGTPRNLDFAALATWKLDDVTRSWCIEPLVANKSRPDPDFGTGWWAGPSDNGWGYSLAQVNDVMIAYIFYYDAEGKPRWSTGFQQGFEPGQDITIPMADVFGYGRTQSLVERTFVPNGSLSLNLSNTFRDVDTDGTTSIDITYQGAEGGRWLRNNTKIMNLLQEH